MVNKKRVDAELEAAKRHLEDTRRLVFGVPRQNHEDDTFSKN